MPRATYVEHASGTVVDHLGHHQPMEPSVMLARGMRTVFYFLASYHVDQEALADTVGLGALRDLSSHYSEGELETSKHDK